MFLYKLKTHYRSLFSLILLLSAFNFSFSQQYIFNAQHITTDEGLANLMTNAIFKDSKGFMWFGTNNGLNRYDGNKFKKFTKEENGLIANNSITNIQKDQFGQLWIITELNGNKFHLQIFDPLLEKAISIEEYIKSPLPFKANDVNGITIDDPQNRIWIATITGDIYLYQASRFEKVYSEAGMLFEHLSIDATNNLWLASDTQLIQINSVGRKIQAFDLSQYFTYKSLISSIHLEKNGDIWLVSRGWDEKNFNFKSTVWYKSKHKSIFEPFTLTDIKDKSASINQIVRTKSGFWYIVFDNRFQIFSPKGERLFDFQDMLNKKVKVTYNQYLEVGNQMWFTTSLGILKMSISENPFQLIHEKEGTSDCRGITEDQYGNIYFSNRRIYQWQPISNRLNKILDSPISAHSLQYHNGHLFSGTYSEHALGTQLDLSTNQIIFLPCKKENQNAYAIQQASNKDLYYVGHNAGMSIWNPTEQQIIPFEKHKAFPIFKKSNIYHIHKSATHYYLASQNGIFLMDETNGILNHFCKENGNLPFNYIQHIHEDKDGLFWLATRGSGLLRWDLNTMQYKIFSTENILSDDYLYASYEDDYNNLWLPSDKGLIQFNKSNLKIKTYTTNEGLPHNEFNLTSHYQTSDGTLYLGGLGGLISFHPKNFEDSTLNQTPLVFTKLQILENGKEALTDKTVQLNQAEDLVIQPDDKLIELEFALLDYNDKNAHSYAYKIQGYLDNWIYTNENFIHITNLPYGNYTLKIKGKSNHKGWSEKELQLKIKVLKPFYLQWYFFLSLAIAILSIGTLYIKRREYNYLKNQKLLEEKVQKRTLTIQQQTEELKSLEQAKNRFFSNITHEFRTPLTLIIGPLEQLLKEKTLSPLIQRKVTGSLNNAHHLLQLINQLLDISKLENGQMKMEIRQGNLIRFTEELIQRLQPLAQKKEQNLLFIKGMENWKIQFDKGKWEKIVYNLVSNALKFTDRGGLIQVSLSNLEKNKNTYIRLIIKDTGLGIKPKELPKIFDRFYQTDSFATRTHEGTGIGLALVKELVEIQKGKIWVASEIGKGTTFEIHLPVLPITDIKGSEFAPSTKIIDIIVPTPTIIAETLNINSQESSKLDLLIIEDNSEMRSYLRSCIDSSKYNIIEAEDGEEGIQKALSIIPDLIISDVMMPQKDGFEVTKAIRNNLTTSHIPLILLTAKTTLESRLEGLQRGADAYLTKPFSPKELGVRIQQLIQIRQLLQKRYQNSHLVKQDKSFQKEDTFITNLRAFIIENLAVSNLNGDYISKQFCLSRIHLYRKLKALTNQSISELVRSIRLEKAAALLEEGKLNITEIAYQTGFTSIHHFSRVFKKQYGESPSKYRKTKGI